MFAFDRTLVLASMLTAAACNGNDATPAADGGSLQIVLALDRSSRVVAGDALPLKVVTVSSDGTQKDLPQSTHVTWTSPGSFVAFDPSDAGAASLPSGSSPNATFVMNPFRPDRTDYVGTLFVLQRGTTDSPNVIVTATVEDAGVVTASIPVTSLDPGDPDAGAALYAALSCGTCHGATGGGSPPASASTWLLADASYPYPAPGLNAAFPDGGTPNLAADPGWNAALFSVAAFGSVDNNGVALRVPMPDWLGATKPDGTTLTAHDFADIYAFLRTQTQ